MRDVDAIINKDYGPFHDVGLKVLWLNNLDVLRKTDMIRCETPVGEKDFRTSGQNRTFFKTADNFLGLGPEEIAIGDEVIVPFGSSRPWVLRKCGGDYQFVGTAVIPSIMAGELMDFYQDGTLEAEDFVLV